MDKVLAMSELHPRDRLAYWHDVACKVLVKHECRVEKLPAFDATIHRAMLGDIGIIEVDSLGLNFAAVTKRNIANEEDDVFLLGLQLAGQRHSDPGRARGNPPARRLRTPRRAAALCQPLLGEVAAALLKNPASRAEGAPGAELATHRARHTAHVGDWRPRVGLHAHDPATHRSTYTQQRGRRSASRSSISPPLHLRRRAARIGRRYRRRAPSRCCNCARQSNGVSPIPRSILRRLPRAAGISVRYANALLAEEGLSIQRLIVRDASTAAVSRCPTRRKHTARSAISHTAGASPTFRTSRAASRPPSAVPLATTAGSTPPADSPAKTCAEIRASRRVDRRMFSTRCNCARFAERGSLQNRMPRVR